MILLLLACKGAADADDSAARDDSAAALPDLVLQAPTKDASTITIHYCNEGAADDHTVALRLMDVDTTTAWEGGGNAFPAPGECLDADPVDCAELGLDCSQSVMVEVVLDPYGAIIEADEANNRGTFPL